MSGSANETARLAPGLRAFLAGPREGEPWPEPAGEYLASRQLFVEEQLLGQPTSRFVSEGGVRLNRVTCYWLSPDDLPAIARRRPGRSRLRFALVKFWLMFDELPPNRQYAVVRIRISLKPPAPVLMLRPDLSTPSTQTGPAATAVDLGADGFGWTFEAQEGSPLLARRQIALVLLELPEEVTELAGLFDAEALVSRRLLGTFTLRRSAPIDSAAPFLVSLADSCP